MTAAAATDTYCIEAGDPARDRDEVLALWNGQLGDPAHMAAKYDWFYRRCPLGEPLLLLLRDGIGGPVVGFAGAGARVLQVGAREVPAAIVVDFAVHPQHRSLGPALLLQQAVLAHAARRFEFVYGFPNRRAAPVFQRVGYRRFGEFLRLVRVLRTRDFLRRKLPALLATPGGTLLDVGVALRDRLRAGVVLARGQWHDAPPAVAADAAADDLMRGRHDATMQRWRFLDGPTPRTRWLQVDPGAWFACRAHGTEIAVDAFGPGAAPSPRAIQALLAAARRAGHASVSVQLLADAALREPWERAGFAVRDRRPVYGCWLGAGAAPAGLLLTAADEDE